MGHDFLTDLWGHYICNTCGYRVHEQSLTNNNMGIEDLAALLCFPPHDGGAALLKVYNTTKSCECGSKDNLHYYWCPKHE